MRKRFPLNVAGDFYVEDGCCTACMLPHYEAPGFLAEPNTENGHNCYVIRQPENLEQIQQACNAMAVADLGCIRYSGNDSGILRQIKEAGGEIYPDIVNLCDVLVEDQAKEKA
jgi:hypothetical protein